MHPAKEYLIRTFDHVPLGADKKAAIDRFRYLFRALAEKIALEVEGPDGTAAMRELRRAQDTTIRGLIFGGEGG